MRGRPANRLPSLSALLFTLRLTLRESTRVAASPGEAAQVDGVDQKVPDDGRKKIATPRGKACKNESGNRGEQGPQAERFPRPAVQDGEGEGRRQPTEGSLHRAAEEQLLGETGQNGEGDRLPGLERPEGRHDLAI